MVFFHSIDDFIIGKPLGTGRFGQVWLVKHKVTGYILGLKMIPMSSMRNNSDVRNLRREIEIHLSMDHPNILKMYGYFYDSTKLYLVLEYAGGGDLWRILQKRKRLTETEASNYISQLCRSLKYMGSRKIIHRDIKPENILLGSDGLLKIADFGWAVQNIDKRRNTFCGTPEYLPPEMCRDDVYDIQADVWCLGILCYEFCTGTTPFSTKQTLRDTKRIILEEEIYPPPYLSDSCIDFIKRCCKKNPKERITLEDSENHPFLRLSKATQIEN